jgi:SnoaL-like domain
MVLDLLTPYDRVQLLEVYARSVMLLELGRCAEWADLFFPEALLRCAGAQGRSPDEFKGRKALLAVGRRLMLGEFDVSAGHLVPPLRTRHMLSNITLFGEEAGHATGYAFLTVTTIGGGEPPRWMGSGKYSDRLHRCPARCWRFVSRTFTADAAVAASNADNSLMAPAVAGIG